MRVGVVLDRRDPAVAKAQDAVRALVDHIGGVGLEPTLLVDLDDDTVITRRRPVASQFLVAPVGSAEAELAIREAPDDSLAAAPQAADRRRAGHPVAHVVGQVLAQLIHAPGEERALVGVTRFETSGGAT